jgi:hypothetical protein
MRLAQLARKIAVKPTEIAAFLANKNSPIEDSSNAKVSDDQVMLVLTQFAPQLLNVPESTEETPVAEDLKIEPIKGLEINVADEEVKAVGEPTGESEITIEVIKAPKVELPGLKVVGKIDLPEPKKKEEEITRPEIENQIQPTVHTQRPERDATRKNLRSIREQDRRPRKNPVALKREREEREALRRREEEEKKEKEMRTQRYLKKVKTKTPPPKAVKRNKHEDDYEVYVSEEPKPKSLMGKILGWFVSE